ncbi:MAG: hypothetical protein AMJ89_01460 [candidate division Zixibacteria bacterium SM23_73]|nr:MAG: hypothetical protein AMJ89_01460 [candidate division Zixibacteria bacterium SM23_73]
MNNEIITVAIMILPLFSAIEKAITAIAKARMSPIKAYGIPMILFLKLIKWGRFYFSKIVNIAA